MKKESNKQRLIADLLADDSDLRAITLQRGLALSRRKHQRRRVWRASLLAFPFVVFAAASWLQLNHQPRRSADVPVGPRLQPVNVARQPPPNVIEGTSVRVLSDEELLDLFKGQPVALVGPPGKRKLLLFDEKVN